MTSTTALVARRTETSRPAGLGGRRGNPALTLLTVALGVMMVALDGTIVAVANPAIQSHLHASLAGIQWITNAYLLALAVSLITIGKLGDRFGHKKVFLTGVTASRPARRPSGCPGASPAALPWSSRSARCRACSGPCCSRQPWPCYAGRSRSAS